MTWPRFMAARQLLAEERIGRYRREADAEEDASINRSMAALRQDTYGNR